MKEGRRLSLRSRLLQEPFFPESPPPGRPDDTTTFQEDFQMLDADASLSSALSRLDLDENKEHQESSESLVEVSAEDARVYHEAMERLSQDQSIVIKEGDLTGRDLWCLAPTHWLNDEIMNSYMKLLQLRDSFHRESTDALKCHFCNSFLLTKITTRYRYSEVRRWTDPRKLRRWGQMSGSIIDCDLIFFPYYHASHWSLILADLRSYSLSLYDSLARGKNPSRMKVMRVIVEYLVDEAQDKCKKTWSNKDFNIQLGSMPQQHNIWDCGVFVVQCTKHLSVGKPLLFSQKDMVHYRIQMFKELVENQLV